MYELNEILEKYGKSLKYLEIRSLCFFKDGKLIQLASNLRFVEEKLPEVLEQKNNLLFTQSYISVETALDRFFSELEKGILINKEKIPVTVDFNYDKLKFSFYRTNDGGHFQCELRGKITQNSDNDFMKGVYSFGADSFYALSREKIGIGIQSIDGTIYMRLPIKMNSDLDILSKTECSLKIESDLLQEEFLYSIKFFNVSEYHNPNSKDYIIKQSFKQSSPRISCSISVPIAVFTQYNTVLVDIYDTESGIILCSKNLQTRNILAKSSVYTSILQEAYSIFRNPENFQKSILQPSQDNGKQRPQKRFELEISRLLNCGGLQAIWLENTDSIKEGEITTISADILAYDDRTLELYIISCKTGTPTSDETVNKIISARNKLQDILQRPEITIRACIITLQEIEETPFMRSEKVILINKKNLEELIRAKSKFSLQN